MNNYKIFFLPSNAATDSPELLTELKRYGVVEHAGKSEADNRNKISDLIEWQDAQTNNVGLIVALAPNNGRKNTRAIVGKGIYSTLELDLDGELTTFFADKSPDGSWRLAEAGDNYIVTRNSDWKTNFAEYDIDPPDIRIPLADYFADAIPPQPIIATPVIDEWLGHNPPAPSSTEISPGVAGHFLKHKP